MTPEEFQGIRPIPFGRLKLTLFVLCSLAAIGLVIAVLVAHGGTRGHFAGNIAGLLLLIFLVAFIVTDSSPLLWLEQLQGRNWAGYYVATWFAPGGQKHVATQFEGGIYTREWEFPRDTLICIVPLLRGKIRLLHTGNTPRTHKILLSGWGLKTVLKESQCLGTPWANSPVSISFRDTDQNFRARVTFQEAYALIGNWITTGRSPRDCVLRHISDEKIEGRVVK